MSGAEQHARTYVHALLGGHGGLLDGLRVTLDTFSGPATPPNTRWLPAQPDVVLAAVADASRTPGLIGVHLGVGMTRGPRGTKPDGKPYHRLAEPIVDGLGWLFADLDVQGTVHGTKRAYPPDKAAAIAVARSTGLDPTIIADTGHGIQAYWRLAEPLIFGWTGELDDDGRPIIDQSRVAADRAAGAKLTRDWFNSLRIRADREHGYFFDPIGDMARLLRVPGTVNRKLADDQRPALVIECDPTRVYDLDQVTAVLASDETLRTYRFNAEVTPLTGVDLPALWRAAKAHLDHTPEWLADLIVSGLSPELTRIWSGAAERDHHHNDSDIDWALAREVLRVEECSAADACEAVMCLRLRTGRKPEKVDPACRTSYLEMTVGKLLAARAERQERRTGIATSMAATLGGLAQGSPVAVLERTEVDDSATGEPAKVEHPTPSSTPSSPLRVVEPLPDPVAEHVGAPRAPRLDHGPQTPAPPDTDERLLCEQLTAALGLPDGVWVWAVGMRRLEKQDEIRIWCCRDEGSEVFGGDWAPGVVRPSRWHPKSLFDAKDRVIDELCFHDFHVTARPMKTWRSEGRPLLYRLARQMTVGTPAEVARLAVVELLCAAAGSGLLSRARDTGDPWVLTEGGEVTTWVMLAAVRERMGRAGWPVRPMVLMDTLDSLGCKVVDGVSMEEPHGRVSDPRQWVRLADKLGDGELWAAVAMRAADRDAAERRAEVRRIGSEET